MKSIASHLSIATVALVAGGIGAVAVTQTKPPTTVAAVTTPPQPALPEQVRTVVVTKTIHHVRHVHAKAPKHTVAAAPPRGAGARVVPSRPAVQRTPVVQAAPVVRAAPVATRVTTHTSGSASRPVSSPAPTKVTTHTSSHGGGGEGGDGGGDGGGGHDD